MSIGKCLSMQIAVRFMSFFGKRNQRFYYRRVKIKKNKP